MAISVAKKNNFLSPSMMLSGEQPEPETTFSVADTENERNVP